MHASLLVFSLVATVSGSTGLLRAQSPATPSPATPSPAPIDKRLPIPGEVFAIEQHPAFLILPDAAVRSDPLPWVLYAPTLPGLPQDAEKWLFERLLAAGIAIAGVDVGESYGNREGRRLHSVFRDAMVRRGLSPRACLLARSRGGLMLYNWAADNPNAVACIAGIYPVCDLASWPGLGRACGAYGLTEAQLASCLQEHNPIDRLAPLARAGVPIFHIHGDADRVVPLAANSAVVQRRYAELGGSMVLVTVAGGGHDMARDWFECQALVDFVLAHARVTGATRGIVDVRETRAPAGAEQLIGDERSVMVPEQPGAESLWAFANGVLTASPKSDSVVTPKAYRDFRLHVEFNVNATESANAEARGNSGVYLQQRYELQILDSFGVSPEHYQDHDCGSLYRMRKPDRVVPRQAGEWQSFDVAFRAARFDGDRKSEDARITAFWNGALIHDDVAIPRKTGAGAKEGSEPRPIKLQGHGNQVRFRNVWVAELE